MLGIRQLFGIASLTLVILILISFNANAKDSPSMVYGIHVGLPLENEGPDSEPKKDYYLNVGSRDGVRKGTQLKVFRRLTTTNEIDRHQIDVHVPVGKLVVVHTEPNVSIAKLVEMESGLAAPVLDVPSVMVGDLVEVSTDVAVKGIFEKQQEDERAPASARIIAPNDSPLNTQYGF